MMNHSAILKTVLVFGCTLFSCSSFQTVHHENPKQKLQRDLDYLFSNPALSTAHWGIVIRSLDTGEYYYRRNEYKLFTPASNLKLLTTGTALLKLGPAYRFSTLLYYRGQVIDSVLCGDLVLKSCGDPSISPLFYEDGPLTVYENFADSLRAAGIKAVDGDVVGDGTCFEDEPLGAGWAWDDQSFGYSAQINALSFNDNCIELLFVPADSIGKPASVSVLPCTDYIEVENNVVTHAESTHIDCRRKANSNRITCSGCTARAATKKVAVHNPARFSATLLAKALRRKGIRISGAIARPGNKTKSEHAVCRHFSPPLPVILTATNKKSQNLYAELLLRTLPGHAGLEATAQNGIKIISEQLKKTGVDPQHIILVDGSGLSRKNKLSPHSLMVFLSYLKKHRYGTVFVETLPVAGIDGTLKYRMQGTAAQGNTRAKTGTLDGVSALSGYVTTQDGEELVFSMMVNSFVTSAKTAQFVQDAVCETLANFNSKANSL